MKNIHMLPTLEVWKDVVGYKSLYQVSNFGNVKFFYVRMIIFILRTLV